ncbi:MAG: flagellar basal body-associated FliL family protein [Actinomycetota bacterium]
MAKKDKDESAEEKSGGKKKIIIIVVALAVVGFGAKTFLLKSPDAEAKPKKEKPVAGEVVDGGSLTVNLADSGYARVGLGLVLNALEGEHGAELVNAMLPMMKDAAITEISQRTSDELLAKHGKEELKKHLSEAAHEIYHEAVLEVVLTEFIVQ